jgi:hypothetical protein
MAGSLRYLDGEWEPQARAKVIMPEDTDARHHLAVAQMSLGRHEAVAEHDSARLSVL